MAKTPEINSPKHITLESATENDFPRIIEIENKLAGKTYTTLGNEEQLRATMAKGPIQLIKREGQTVGVLAYYPTEDASIYIDALAVEPEHQGQGIGREALQQALGQIKATQKIWLVTHPDNISVKLYESLGFKTQERKENYFGDGEPRIIMTLERQPN